MTQKRVESGQCNEGYTGKGMYLPVQPGDARKG